MGSSVASSGRMSGEPRPRGVAGTLAAGVRFAGACLRGRGSLGVGRADFFVALLRGVRAHFFAFPCGAALAGAASVSAGATSWRVWLTALAVGVGWGVGQLLNDLVDVDADRIDAPDRPAVMGLLPEGPTALVASLLGLLVAIALSVVHPLGWVFALSSASLMLLYAPAKALPVLGNVTHGALMALLALMGAAAAAPALSLVSVLGVSWPVIGLVFALAVLYLQGNYEKDRDGDAQAGYHTLAVVTGVRGSSGVRTVLGASLYSAAAVLGLIGRGPALWLWFASALSLAVSVAPSLWRGNRRGALLGYRFAVHSTLLGFAALMLPGFGAGGTLGALVAAGLLVEAAFARSPNP